MGRPAHRADIGEAVEPLGDVLRENAASAGCLALMHAQLRKGAHILPLPLARKLGASVGLHRDEIGASNDPSLKTKGPKA